jgi:hypothetical protein
MKVIKWEYKVKPLTIDISSEMFCCSLNKMGQLGWELVCIQVVDTSTKYIIFKRPVGLSTE